jgi:putative membrane protein
MWGYGPEWGMMGGWGGYGWMGAIHVIFWVLILVLIIAVIVWFFRSGFQAAPPSARLERRSPGLDVLEERYARGEINRDEYLQKRRDITG